MYDVRKLKLSQAEQLDALELASGELYSPRTDLVAISRVQLSDMYLKNGMSMLDIAEVFNCSRQTIVNKLRRYDIPMRNRKRFNIEKTQLVDLYLGQKLSIYGISRIFNCSYNVIANRLIEYGISTRRHKIAIPLRQIKYMYVTKRMSACAIADALKVCSFTTIIERLKDYGIPIRNGVEAKKIKSIMSRRCNIGKAQLIDLYLEQNMSARSIGRLFDCRHEVIIRRLTEYGISVRSQAEALKTPSVRKRFLEVQNDPMRKIKQSNRLKQSWKNPEERANMSQRLSVSLQKWWRQLSCEQKDIMVKSMHQGLHRRPTKPEIVVRELLDNVFPNEWEYVGDGKLIIGGKNPDFAKRTDGKRQIIEVFGDWWHGEQLTGRNKKEEEEHRMQIFREYGYDTLIIWESELKEPQKVLAKVSNFS